MSIAASDVDTMLLREFERASFNNRRAAMARLATRAIDKVLAEYNALGFAGFIVREVNGRLEVDGISARELTEIPAHIRSGT